MQLSINGKDHAIEKADTVADVLNHLNIARERVAVVVNEQVVRRANLESTPLNEGDVIEIITMVGGG
jgi:sulfur carrier protein